MIVSLFFANALQMQICRRHGGFDLRILTNLFDMHILRIWPLAAVTLSLPRSVDRDRGSIDLIMFDLRRLLRTKS